MPDDTVTEARRQLDEATRRSRLVQEEHDHASLPERADILPRLELANQYRARCWGRYYAARDRVRTIEYRDEGDSHA
jgi:hypothetical protein